MQPPKLMPQKINKSKKKHSKNSILVERHVAIDKVGFYIYFIVCVYF